MVQLKIQKKVIMTSIYQGAAEYLRQPLFGALVYLLVPEKISFS